MAKKLTPIHLEVVPHNQNLDPNRPVPHSRLAPESLHTKGASRGTVVPQPARKESTILVDEELSQYPYCRLPQHFFEKVELGTSARGITAALPALPRSTNAFISRLEQ